MRWGHVSELLQPLGIRYTGEVSETKERLGWSGGARKEKAFYKRAHRDSPSLRE